MAEEHTTPLSSQFSGSINLSVTRKKRYLIDDDENRVLELNTSDMNIIQRIAEVYPKFEALEEKASHIGDGFSPEDTSVDALKTVGDRLKAVDTEMRNLLDYLFDSNVSEVCAPYGSMYDPIEGDARYEHIINAIIPLYDETISAETKKVKARVKKHTAKYTKKYHN